ncbi:hypothetical protein BH10BAC4_BH10BAC4_25880 [soil metagenome]
MTQKDRAVRYYSIVFKMVNTSAKALFISQNYFNFR